MVSAIDMPGPADFGIFSILIEDDKVQIGAALAYAVLGSGTGVKCSLAWAVSAIGQFIRDTHNVDKDFAGVFRCKHKELITSAAQEAGKPQPMRKSHETKLVALIGELVEIRRAEHRFYGTLEHVWWSVSEPQEYQLTLSGMTKTERRINLSASDLFAGPGFNHEGEVQWLTSVTKMSPNEYDRKTKGYKV